MIDVVDVVVATLVRNARRDGFTDADTAVVVDVAVPKDGMDVVEDDVKAATFIFGGFSELDTVYYYDESIG